MKAKLNDRKKNMKMEGETNKLECTYEGDQPDIQEKSLAEEENRERKNLKNKKRKKDLATDAVSMGSETNYNNIEDGSAEQNGSNDMVQKSTKRKPKLKKCKKNQKSLSDKVQPGAENYSEEGNNLMGGVSRKADRKIKNITKEAENRLQKRDVEGEEVYQISSGDKDCSTGMKKWITEYQYKRPGLKVLQDRIDDFITEHEAKQEKERREKESRDAEDGWTVVTHHKGRKKTTDTETGVVVGSVTQAAVLDKMAKKKSKGVGVDFYRFQKREAHRNEVMMLQSKFEQDRKRIQQLRAARKFRPY